MKPYVITLSVNYVPTNIQQRLLLEKELTYACTGTLQIAQSMENT